MPYGNRGILAAFAGLAALFLAFGMGAYVTGLNNPEQERYEPYRYAPDKPLEIDPAAAGEPNAQALQDRTPCEQPKGRDESDLCAQWKAASAGERNTLWTARGFWIGVVGSALLLWQIALTRQAVEDTSEATEAMREANHIAANTQRPWISISANLVSLELIGRRVISFGYVVQFKNTGAMVAEAFFPEIEFVPMDAEFLEHMKESFETFEKNERIQDTAVIPGDAYEYAGQSSRVVEYLPWETREGLRKDCYLILLAMCRYRIPGDPKWHFSMQGFSIGQNRSLVDNRNFSFDFPDTLTINDMVVKRMGRSRAS